MKNIKFINAGAGSGKTHRLTEILAKWIEEGNNANEVLLTTFTKKAASEIRERAQSKLLVNKEFIQANKLNDAFIGTVHSVGYQFIKKYWYLLDISPDLTEISEKERNIFFSQAISSVPTSEELYQFNDICYQFNFQKFEDDFSKYNKEQWKDDVIKIINEALTNNIDLVNDNSSLEVSLQKWNTTFNDQTEEINTADVIDEINLLITNNVKTSISYKEFFSGKLIEIRARKKEKNLKLLIDIEQAINHIKKYVYSGTGKNSNEPSLRESLPKTNVAASELFKTSGINYINLIFKIAKESLNSYKIFKQEKGLVDYTDMEVHFLNLLDKKIVQDEITETIKMVMVDEFQDSNPIQLSIFMKLSLLTKESYWVGDPKQAIYGFRGSDPVLIDAVIKEFTKQNEKGLTIDILKMSWRSVPELVNFSNQIFEQRMLEQSSDIYVESTAQIHGPERKDPISKPEITFNNWIKNREIHPLHKKDTIGLLPVRTSAEKLEGSPIKFWNFLSPTHKSLNKEIYFQKLAQKTASIIKKGENGSFQIIDKKTGLPKNLKGGDICILMSANKKVSDLAEEFYKLGYPVNAIIEGLTDTVEYRIIQNIITLFLEPNNALSSTELAYLTGEVDTVEVLLEQRIALLLPLLKQKELNADFNIYESLNEWLNENEHKECITQLRNQARHLSVYYTIQQITNQFNVFQKLLNFNNAELRQSNVLKLCELAKEYETYCVNMNFGSSLTGFLAFIESNKENNVQAINTNSNAINIMTYHKAKGLEWPMVILSDIDKDPLDKFIKNEIFSTRIINSTDLDVSDPLKNRVIEFSFWPFGTSNSVNDELKDKIEAIDAFNKIENNKLNEASRLMYVGITRARDYLIFATNQYQNATWLEDVVPNWNLKEALESIKFNTITTTEKVNGNLFNLVQDCSIEYEKIMPESEFETDFNLPPQNYFKKVIPLSQNTPYFINPSKEESLKTCKVEELEKEFHTRLTIKTNDSTELGNTLHQFLYIKDRSYFEKQVKASEAFDKLGVDKDAFIANTEKLNQWLNTNFNKFKQYSEFSMEVEMGKQLAKGEADLVLETDEGLVLIDYKSYAGTDDVRNSSCEYFAGKYSVQLDLYAQMLERTFESKKVIKKLIYYVVQGKIVELK